MMFDDGAYMDAYSRIKFEGSAEQIDHGKKVDFILDRPFGYVLIGAGGIPVMSGIINQL